MRVTDDRYRRERRAFDLAWRLIRHSARTSTIASWTGLTERRIRSLQQTYGRDLEVTLYRPRGRAPRRIDSLLQSAKQRQLASRFAELCCKHAVLPDCPLLDPGQALPSIDRGEQLCAAFEEFQTQYPQASLTIEHAIALLMELARREAYDLVRCGTCHQVTIIDRLSALDTRCLYCSHSLPPPAGCREISTAASAQCPTRRKMGN